MTIDHDQAIAAIVGAVYFVLVLAAYAVPHRIVGLARALRQRIAQANEALRHYRKVESLRWRVFRLARGWCWHFAKPIDGRAWTVDRDGRVRTDARQVELRASSQWTAEELQRRDVNEAHRMRAAIREREARCVVLRSIDDRQLSEELLRPMFASCDAVETFARRVIVGVDAPLPDRPHFDACFDALATDAERKLNQQRDRLRAETFAKSARDIGS